MGPARAACEVGSNELLPIDQAHAGHAGPGRMDRRMYSSCTEYGSCTDAAMAAGLSSTPNRAIHHKCLRLPRPYLPKGPGCSPLVSPRLVSPAASTPVAEDPCYIHYHVPCLSRLFCFIMLHPQSAWLFLLSTIIILPIFDPLLPMISLATQRSAVSSSSSYPPNYACPEDCTCTNMPVSDGEDDVGSLQACRALLHVPHKIADYPLYSTRTTKWTLTSAMRWTCPPLARS